MQAQLDSLENQSHTAWQLWASDDGSNDATQAILANYRHRWGAEKLVILAGPAKGFVANFLYLCCQREIRADFFAFCDQDDIWESEKLSRALDKMRSLDPAAPLLYCSRTTLIDDGGAVSGLSPLFPRPPVFRNALVQSIAGGNTMVFNLRARELIFQIGEDIDVVTHDWLLYLAVTACKGIVLYDPKPTTRYRQHGRNVIGANSGWQASLRRAVMLARGDFRHSNNRNASALERILPTFSPQNEIAFNRFCKARTSGLVSRIRGFRRVGVYRQTVLGQLGLWIGAILGRI